MHTATARLKSITPYSQRKYIQTPKLAKETAQDHEERVWRDGMHVDGKGVAYIPPMAFKNCISEAAKFLSIQIPGKGKATYTKHFEAGVMVLDGLSLGVKKEDVEGNWLHVPSDGRRGGTTRVLKCFPIFRQWAGDVTFHILDDTITQEVFTDHLKEAGNLIGIGVFRPRNNGFFGRFLVESVTWV